MQNKVESQTTSNTQVAPTEPNYKELLLSLIASMTLADHMGDVCDDVQVVMDKMGIECSVDLSGEGEAHDFKRLLHNMGAKTVYGTEIWDDDDEMEYLSEREDEENDEENDE